VRTTLDLSDDLMKRLLRATRAKTKTAAVEAAIEDFLRRQAVEELIALSGKVQLDLDWRKMEAEELRDARRLYGPTARRRRR
jgi:Arc/MetJ family transcription regulator